MARSSSQDRQGHSRDHVEEGCERTQNKTKRRDNPHDDVDDAPPDTTTQHNSAQHELALCDRCHTAWASGAHGWVPAGHPRYTRADYDQEAVGGSTSRAAHATQVTDTQAVNKGGDQKAW